MLLQWEQLIKTFGTRWQIVLLLIVTVLLAACQGSAGPDSSAQERAPTVTISVSGAFALFPLMSVWAEQYSALNPNVRFDLQAGGAGKGMTDVIGGAVDLAMLSREPRQAELDQGVILVPAAIDAVVATINADNPQLNALLTTGLSPERGAAIWLTGDMTTWGELSGQNDSTLINVYTRSDASGAAEVWALYLGGTAQEDLQGTAVNGDPGLAEAVRQDVQGIGFNNIGFAYDLQTGEQVDGIRVLPLDLNGDGQISSDEDFYQTKPALVQAIGGRRYPFPPARQLYLVTNGQPSPEIARFYRWMLTDGQSFVETAGYVGLDAQTIQDALTTLPQE